MTESRRLAMRRAHANHASFCSCGKIVHGNGATAMHRAMHKRRNDGHHYLVEDHWRAKVAAGEIISQTGKKRA
jgi:hypothetical protein